ncbi:MAG: archaemetzincin family Zn-dependent metalloprotease [Salinivirgaceae bacterium]
MKKQQIIFFIKGQFEPDCLQRLSQEVSLTFNRQVHLRNLDLDIEPFYDFKRRQYDANKILHWLDANEDTENDKKIALISVDLYIPILTFLFGQAIFNGNSGVVSNYRLRNEQYGLAPDYELTFLRFKKVIIHELGHMFGLVHCQVPTCVMRSSTYVEDIDQKKSQFCSICGTKIESETASE